MTQFARDLRHAARALCRAPGFTIAAVLTLGLGIGVVTAVFTLVDQVTLRPLPYPDAERLVRIESHVASVGEVWGLSEASYHFLRTESRTLEAIGGVDDVFERFTVVISDGEQVLQVPAAVVDATTLSLLGARTARGRLFAEGEGAPGSPRVVVLGYDLWRHLLGADPGILGRALRIGGEPHEVIGIMARGIHPPGERVGAWLPLSVDPLGTENDHWVGAIARLASGATLEQAQRELTELTSRFPEELSQTYGRVWMERQGFSTVVVPLRERVLGGVERLLWPLLGAVALVLIVAFANVANLFLVRGEGRRREVAIRASLGAGRRRLLFQGIAEGVLVAVAAAAVGAAVAAAGLRLFAVFAPNALPRLLEVEAGWQALGVAMALGLLAGVALGALPVLVGRLEPGLLRDGTRQLASRPRHRLRGTLVASQVALSLVLLAAAGLMLESFQQLRRVPLGFDPGGLLVFQLTLPQQSYGDLPAINRFLQTLVGRIEALPGVERAGATRQLPIHYKSGCYELRQREWPAEVPNPCVQTLLAAPGYLESLRLPVRGSFPSWSGDAEVLVTRTLAERLWPGEDPIGKGIRGFNWGDAPDYRVVGVTGDLRMEGPEGLPTEAVFMPLVPTPGTEHWGPYYFVEESYARELFVAVRSSSAAPRSLAPAVREVVAELDPHVVASGFETMDRLLASSESVARVSLLAVLLGVAGMAVLLLAAIGLYGVIAYVVGQRTHEIGLRMALGAPSSAVAGAVLRRSLGLALAGVVAGVVVALLAAPLVEALLFEAQARNPAILVGAALLLLSISLISSWLPARRAMRVDPVRALRQE